MAEPYNPDLWDSELNDALYKAVIERVFDFSLIALDIRDYIIMSGMDKDFELYTRDQCRLHWSHIHALREEAIKQNEEAPVYEELVEPPKVEEKVAPVGPDFSKVQTTTFDGRVITPSTYNVEYDTLDDYKEQLDKQMADIEKFIHEQKELIEEEKVDGEEGDELLEYRYIRKPNGEIVIMAKPFFKLTPKELRDTENCMTNVPFDENDPDVKVYRLKNPEKFPQFKVDTGLEDRKNNMDVKGKKPREKDEPIKPLEEVKEKKAPEKTMEQV